MQQEGSAKKQRRCRLSITFKPKVKVHPVSGIRTTLGSGRKELAATGAQNEHPKICFCGMWIVLS